jgi:RF-1 domain
MTDSSASLHPAALDPAALLASCEVRFTRRSGPGGQNRNKVETAVILTHRPTGITAEASEQRSQGENRKAALFRLRLNLALQVRGEVAEGSVPSALWQSRCRAGKIHISPSHIDFPALLSEALDRVVGRSFEVKDAATELGCTASQLIKFLKAEPRAFLLVNQGRQERGLHTLQ